MNSLHTIRLKRPWTRIQGESQSRVDAPDLSEPIFDGAAPPAVVEYRRSFHAPTGLEPKDVVWLELEQASGLTLRLSLNDALLHQTGSLAEVSFPLRLDVTSLLRPQNSLSVQLQGDPSAPPVLSGTVSLKIASKS